MIKLNEQIEFNIFSFLSTFARSLIEIFISLYLFKNGISFHNIILFYFFVNMFAVPLSYFFVKLGEKTKYIYIMIIGLITFVIVQLLLRNVINSNYYLILLAFVYSVYRRGYWVARRLYITEIMPTNKTSGLFSIVLVLSQLASIVAGCVGSIILNNVGIVTLTIISSTLLFLSVIPLLGIKHNNVSKDIKLKESIKKYNKNNYLVFSFYELNNLLTFIFPIYIALHVENSYFLAGNLNAISNIAIILFIMIYGKVLDKNKNYIATSTILVLLCAILKFNIKSYYILAIYFVEGIVTKMQSQSVNKIYFENRGDMDLTHYNLIYQIMECLVRALVTFPLLFIDDIRIMIIFVICVISSLLIIYMFNIKNKKYTNNN